MFVCQNRPLKCHYNIRCTGNLGTTFLKRNEIGDAAYGLHCQAGTVMPPQDRFENRWTGTTYVNRGAEYQGGAPGFKIFYDPSNTIPDDKPNTVFPTTGWFEGFSGSNPNCGFNSGLVTERERQFIDGAVLPDATAGNWDERRVLLYKLMRHPELPAGDLDAANYLSANETAGSSPWKFARAEQLFDQAYVLSAPLQTAFSNMSAQFRTLADTLAALDVQQAQDTTTFDPAIAQQRSAAFDQLVVTADSLEQLRAQAKPAVQPALQTALTYSQNLPDAQVHEDNLKDILTIAVRYAQGDSLLGSDFAALRAIATQCPATGGVSVRRAPQWLEHDEAVEYIDKEWDDNCVSPLVSDKDLLSEPLKIQVVPNPANGQAQILFPDNASGHWQITDLAGRTLLEGTVYDIVEVSTANIASGLYLLTCRLSTGNALVTKFSICH
jgi:hypothetical protein